MLRVADDCCTDEGTRRKQTYRDAGENNKENKEKKKRKRKQGTKARKSYSRRLHSNKSSRLYYKAQTGTLSHHLPSSSCSRRQRYQVSLLPLSSLPPREQINENQTKLPGLEGCSNSGSTYWSNQYLATRSTISFLHSSTAVSIRLPLPFPPPLPITLGVLCCVA